MTRSMKDAISSVFDRLVAYAALRGQSVELPPNGSYRTIYGDREQQAILARMGCPLAFRVSERVAMGLFTFDDGNYLGTVGLEFEPELEELDLVDLGSGAGVVLLVELNITPKAGPAQIVNVVGAGSSADEGYDGHSFDAIHSLFPEIRLFKLSADFSNDDPWPLILKTSVSEVSQRSSWISSTLQGAINELADLQAIQFPYGELSRAIFDLDPRNLFMALYRCIEATYAREACEALRTSLGLDIPWYELARHLVTSIGWRAPEAHSINLILKHTDPDDLQMVSDALGADPADDACVRAGRAIYALRNKIVHFRPGDDRRYADTLDWDRVCTHLARIVRDIYGMAYPVPAAGNASALPASPV